MTPKRKIYAASSWKNPMHDATVCILEAAGFEVYNFKGPHGFGWHEVGITDPCTFPKYMEGISKTRADEGFKADFDAMEWADTFVLTLPCGRSAHLELGWAVGQGKDTFILFDGREPLVTPELMYKMVTGMTDSHFDLLGMLGVED